MRSSILSALTQARERKRKTRRLALTCFAVAVVALLTTFVCVACSRVVLVTEASPIRIGPDCRTQVYTLDGTEWRLGDNRVQIPEGWYCVPPSYVAEK